MASIGAAVALEIGGALAIEAARQGLKRMKKNMDEEGDEIPPELEDIYEEEHSEESPQENEEKRKMQMTRFRKTLTRNNPLVGLIKKGIRAITPQKLRSAEHVVEKVVEKAVVECSTESDVLEKEIKSLRRKVGEPQRVRVPNPPKNKQTAGTRIRVEDLHKSLKEKRKTILLRLEKELADLETIRMELDD